MTLFGRSIRPALPIVLACVALAPFAGCSSDTSATDVTVDDETLQRGAELYTEFCASCHGAEGGGGVGPAISDGRAADRVGGVDELSDLIANGGEQMPGLGSRLTSDQIEAISVFVLDRL